MKTTIDYSSSPAKRFDAVEDIKKYLGAKKFDELSPQMARVSNPKEFTFYCMIAGIEGFPVEAWYDLYQGEGAYRKALQAQEEL
jgi:hypothetical protein